MDPSGLPTVTVHVSPSWVTSRFHPSGTPVRLTPVVPFGSVHRPPRQPNPSMGVPSGSVAVTCCNWSTVYVHV